MKKKIVRFLLFIYKNFKRSNFLRSIIKNLIGNDKIEITFNNFIVQAGIKSAIELNVIFDSYNEVIELELIKKYTLEGYDFIDIGANIGLHSLTAATSSSDIEIYSFEPEPNNYQNFIKNILLNKYLNIRPFKLGLGNYVGNNTLNINEGWNKGRHSMKVNFEGSCKKINIPVTKLDYFIENIKTDKLIIKIDVEGFEKEVIEGAKQIINKTKNIVLIIELITESNGYLTCKEIVDILRQNEFINMYKIGFDNELFEVSDYEGSADYIFIKGRNAIKNFNL